MRVKATAPGFYGHLREAGDEFDIRNDADLGNWMIEVFAKAETPKNKQAKTKADDEPDNLPDA